MKVLLQVPSIYPYRFRIFHESFMEHMMPNFPDWKINLINSAYYGKHNMCHLRTMNIIECHYVMQCDDDFVWNPECVEYYKEIEKILEQHHPDVLNVFGSRYPRELSEPKNCMIGTNRGLFIKKCHLDSLDWLNEIKDLKYGLEESVLSFKALENDGKFMVIGQSPLERTHKSGNIEYDNPSILHDLAYIEENCIRFIRERYKDPAWCFETGNFPRGLKMGIDIIDTHNKILKSEALLNSEFGIDFSNSPSKKQIGGDHYSKLAIQPFEYCHKNHLEGAESAVIAYVTRHRDKNKAEDLKKAIHTLELLLEAEYGEQYDRSN
jgi:hypothetical protein